MTNTGLDGAFGGVGSVTLPAGYRLKNTLATNNTIYVDLVRKSDQSRRLFKYNNRGKLDGQWGDGGSVALTVFDAPLTDASKLAFDGHSGDIYVAAVPLYEGRSELNVQRINAYGFSDQTFGTTSVNLPGDDSDRTGTIGRLMPMVHHQLLIATNIRQTNAGGASGTESVQLTRLTQFGRADRTFDKDGTTTVISGSFSSNAAGTDVTRDVPTVTQLADWFSESYRVVDVRHTYHYQLSTDPHPVILGGTDLQSADSIIVHFDGSVSTLRRENEALPLVRTKISPASRPSFESPRFFVPLTARIMNGDGVQVIGGKGIGQRPEVTSPVKMFVDLDQRGVQSYDALGTHATLLDDQPNGTVLRTDDSLQRLDFLWMRDSHWGRRGRTTIDADLTTVAVDGDGSVLAVSDNGRTLYRFNGKLSAG